MTIRPFENKNLLLNMSVWQDVDSLRRYVYHSEHVDLMRRRREFFERLPQAFLVLWWVPRGHIPTVGEAEDRIKELRAHGPTAHAFTLREHFPAPESGDAGLIRSPDEWSCPV